MTLKEVNRETKKLNVESQTSRLVEINNQLRLLNKEKKAIQRYIEEENDRKVGLIGLKDKAYQLREDPEFIKTHGRRRYYWEIGNILGYCEKSISRIFNEEKKDISKR